MKEFGCSYQLLKYSNSCNSTWQYLLGCDLWASVKKRCCVGGPVVKQSRQPTQALWQGPVSLKGHGGDTGFACFRQLRLLVDHHLECGNCWAQMLFNIHYTGNKGLLINLFVTWPCWAIPESDVDHMLGCWSTSYSVYRAFNKSRISEIHNFRLYSL